MQLSKTDQEQFLATTKRLEAEYALAMQALRDETISKHTNHKVGDVVRVMAKKNDSYGKLVEKTVIIKRIDLERQGYGQPYEKVVIRFTDENGLRHDIGAIIE